MTKLDFAHWLENPMWCQPKSASSGRAHRQNRRYCRQKFLDWQQRQGGRRTATEFADWLGFENMTVNNWLNGKRTPIRGNIYLLALKLGLETYDVLGLPRPDEALYQINVHWHMLKDEEKAAISKIDQRAMQKRLGFVPDYFTIDDALYLSDWFLVSLRVAARKMSRQKAGKGEPTDRAGRANILPQNVSAYHLPRKAAHQPSHESLKTRQKTRVSPSGKASAFQACHSNNSNISRNPNRPRPCPGVLCSSDFRYA